MSLFKRRFLFEADDDENQAAPDQSSEDDEASESEENSDNDETPGENNVEDEDDSSENTDEPEEEADENYDIDSEQDDSDENNESEEYVDKDITDADDNNDTAESEEKELDRELFNSLSEDEKKRKVETLKRLFMDLYSNCDSLVDRFNQITTDNDDFSPVIKRILSTLYDLKEYISYYLINIYNNKSYIENDITFNRYLSVLNGIKLVVKELEKTSEK